ncbi:MAG TPA: hypothetical protein VK034_20215 [Enhygromyxa sp.]|nr:hypothetical protein [Enhygromyxa sp.]
MVELATLLHEISVAFGCSSNTRTLLARLADGMGRHLSVAEVESVRLLEHRREVRISAYAPGSGRWWEGRRSSRFLEQQGVVAPTLVTDELARVAIVPIAGKLKLPVGRTGLLAIAFETEISVLLGSIENTEILVDVLALHCLRLGQLAATATQCRQAHRALTEKSVISEPEIGCEKFTETAVDTRDLRNTEIPVETVDAALVRCIGAALEQTRGKIYGTSGAAALLGLKPSTLQSKMRKLGIERSRFT